MHEKLLKYKRQVSEKWSEMDKGLKIKIIVIAIGLMVTLSLWLYLSFRPEWVVLSSKSNAEVVGKIEGILTDKGISSRITERATSIEVKEKDYNKARIAIESSDISKDDITYESVSSNMGIGMTEGDKKEQYKRLKEAEMKKLIETFDNVKEASVLLALPEDTVIFNNSKKEASAGVTLKITSGFTREQGAIIANLIASSVEGIEPKNVTIANTDGEMLYSGNDNSSFSYSKKEEIEKNKREEIDAKIKESLGPLFDEIKVLSTIKFDWDKKQERNLVYTPPVDEAVEGVPTTKIQETENVKNGEVGQEPGVQANDQNPPNYAMGGDNKGTYDSAKEQTEYAYNEKEEIKQIDGGSIIPEESSIAVTVYRHKYYDEESLMKDGTINKELSFENFKEQNKKPTLIDIDEELIETIKTGTGVPNITVTGYEKPVFIDKVKTPIKTEQIVVLIILVILMALLAFALIKKAQPDEIEEIEPEISIEDLIATNKREDEEVAEKLSTINEIESEFKLKIEDFIDDKPELVAQLLKNWINDEWE